MDAKGFPEFAIVNFRGTGFVSKMIQSQTDGPWNHSAIVFRDGSMYEARFGQKFMRRQWGLKPFKDKGWVIMEPQFGVSPQKAHEVKQWLDSLVGKVPYDWRQLLRFVTRLRDSRRSEGSMFCSEAATVAAQRAGRPPYPVARKLPQHTHPNDLYETPLYNIYLTSEQWTRSS